MPTESTPMRLFHLIIALLLFQAGAFANIKYNGISKTWLDKPEVTYVFKKKAAKNILLTKPVDPPLLKKTLIMIDAGHGGDDMGTISLSKPIYQEKSLTLVTAKFLKDYLMQMGYQILMTRSDDIFIPVIARAEMANEQKPTLFVSVHYNSAPSPDAQGIEIFYYKSDVDKIRSKASKELASKILHEVTNYTQAKSRGIKSGNYAVIRETKMPAVLIEGGFLTNQEEMDRIKNPLYLKRLAWGIAKGIDQYIKIKGQG